MTTPAYCKKCQKNNWIVSIGSEKQIHMTCLCGFNFIIKPPTPMEILENNRDALRVFIEKMLTFCPLSSKCSKECSGSWYSCFQATMINGINPFGSKIDVPKRP